MTFYSVTQVADRIGCRPRDISDAFYARILDETRIIRVGNRRAIPADYIAEIRSVLAQRHKLEEAAAQ
jgi:hypothetical protein